MAHEGKRLALFPVRAFLVVHAGNFLWLGTMSFGVWQRHERWRQGEPKRTETYRRGWELLAQERDGEVLRRRALDLHRDRESVRQINSSMGDDLRLAAGAMVVVLAASAGLLGWAVRQLDQQLPASKSGDSLPAG